MHELTESVKTKEGVTAAIKRKTQSMLMLHTRTGACISVTVVSCSIRFLLKIGISCLTDTGFPSVP